VKTRLMAEESSGMLMVTSMRVSGKRTKQMVMESIFTLTVLNMKDTGRTISKTAKVWKAGKTAADTREDTKRV